MSANSVEKLVTHRKKDKLLLWPIFEALCFIAFELSLITWHVQHNNNNKNLFQIVQVDNWKGCELFLNGVGWRPVQRKPATATSNLAQVGGIWAFSKTKFDDNFG